MSACMVGDRAARGTASLIWGLTAHTSLSTCFILLQTLVWQSYCTPQQVSWELDMKYFNEFNCEYCLLVSCISIHIARGSLSECPSLCSRWYRPCTETWSHVTGVDWDENQNSLDTHFSVELGRVRGLRRHFYLKYCNQYIEKYWNSILSSPPVPAPVKVKQEVLPPRRYKTKGRKLFILLV